MFVFSQCTAINEYFSFTLYLQNYVSIKYIVTILKFNNIEIYLTKRVDFKARYIEENNSFNLAQKCTWIFVHVDLGKLCGIYCFEKKIMSLEGHILVPNGGY